MSTIPVTAVRDILRRVENGSLSPEAADHELDRLYMKTLLQEIEARRTVARSLMVFKKILENQAHLPCLMATKRQIQDARVHLDTEPMRRIAKTAALLLGFLGVAFSIHKLGLV